MFHTLMPAGIPRGIFQKEHNKEVPAAVPVLGGIGNLDHLARTLESDSLALPFVFQSNSQNQIPKMKMYLQWAKSHRPRPFSHQKSGSR